MMENSASDQPTNQPINKSKDHVHRVTTGSQVQR